MHTPLLHQQGMSLALVLAMAALAMGTPALGTVALAMGKPALEVVAWVAFSDR